MSEDRSVDAWINAIPQEFHDLYLNQSDYWDIWRKQDDLDVVYAVSTYNQDFLDYVTGKAKGSTVGDQMPNLSGFSDFAGDTFYKRTETRVAVEKGQKYLKEIQEKYQNNYLEAGRERLEKIFAEMVDYEFRFFVLVAVSYLEELIKENVKSSSGKSKAKFLFGENTKEFTLCFCINYLFAQGYIDGTSLKALNYVRKIRNTVAHNALIDQKREEEIQVTIANLNKLTPKGLLWTEKPTIAKKEMKIQQVYPVIENLSLSLLLLNAYILPQQKLTWMFYDVLNGGFRVAQHIEAFTHRSLHYFDSKFDDLGVRGTLPHETVPL